MTNFIATAIAKMAVGTASGILGINSFFYKLAYTASYLVVSVGINTFIAKKMMGKVEQGTEQRLTFSSSYPRRLVYGETLVSGVVVHAETSGNKNKKLHLVVAIGEGEMESIEDAFINDTQLNLTADSGALIPAVGNDFRNLVKIYFHSGTDTQTHDTVLAGISSQWDANHDLRGIAYVYIELTYNKDKFAGGIPNIRFKVKGRKVYDPRKDTANGYSGSGAHTTTNSATWEYSSNPMLCLRDFLKNERTLGVLDSELGDSRFIEMANNCDSLVYLNADNSTSQKRFECNGVARLDSAPIAIAESLLSSCAGSLSYTQGVYQPQVGVAIPNSRNHVLTADYLSGGVSIVTKAEKANRFNAVRGLFSDKNNTYLLNDFSPVKNTTYQTEDGEQLWFDMELPFTTDNTMAQRLAKIALEQSRQAIVVTFQGNLKCLPFAVNDSVTLTLDPDADGSAIFSNKKFRIINWDFSLTGGVDLTLREEADGSYDWAHGEMTTVDLAPNTNLPSALTIPAPSGVTATASTVINLDGTSVGVISGGWTESALEFIHQYEVILQNNSSGSFQNQTTQYIDPDTLTYQFTNLQGGLTYRVAVRAISTEQQRSAFAYSSSVGGANFKDTVAPSAPTSFSAQANTESIIIIWSNPTDLDFSHTELYVNTSNNSGSATLLAKVKGNVHTHNGLTNGEQRYYWVKAFDLSGNSSSLVGSVNATALLLNTLISNNADVSATKVGLASAINTIFSTGTTTINGGVITTNTIVANAILLGDTIISEGSNGGIAIASLSITGTQLANLTIPDGKIASVGTNKLTGTIADSQIAGVGAGKVSGQLATSNIPPIISSMLDSGFEIAETKITGFSSATMQFSKLGVGVANSGTTGSILASNDITAFSDIRLKKNVVTIPHALEKVNAMRGVYFDRQSSEEQDSIPQKSSGVIAQELEKIAPELVRENGDYKSVAYGNLVGYLIEAVKELSAKVDKLEGKE